MFARKVRSIFVRLLPKPKKEIPKKVNFNTKIYKPCDKVFPRNYRTGKSYWEDGSVIMRIGIAIYIIKRKRFDHKRPVKQLEPRYIESIEQNNVELPMGVVYDAFEITPPINQKALVDMPPAPSTSYSPQIPRASLSLTVLRRKSLREKNAVKLLRPNPKKKKY